MRKLGGLSLATVTAAGVAGVVLATQGWWIYSLALAYIALALTLLTVLLCARHLVRYFNTELHKLRRDALRHNQQLSDDYQKLSDQQSKSTTQLVEQITEANLLLEETSAKDAARIKADLKRRNSELGNQIEEALRSTRITIESNKNSVTKTFRESEERINKLITDDY